MKLDITKYYKILLLITFFSLAVFAQDAASPVLDSTAVETPPEWLVEILNTIQSLPIVGPYLVVILQWLGVVFTIVTTFTLAIITSVRALMTVAKWQQLFTVVAALENFQKGKIMYWLKYFSMFNAKKEEPKKEEPKAA